MLIKYNIKSNGVLMAKGVYVCLYNESCPNFVMYLKPEDWEEYKKSRTDIGLLDNNFSQQVVNCPKTVYLHACGIELHPCKED